MLYNSKINVTAGCTSLENLKSKCVQGREDPPSVGMGASVPRFLFWPSVTGPRDSRTRDLHGCRRFSPRGSLQRTVQCRGISDSSQTMRRTSSCLKMWLCLQGGSGAVAYSGAYCIGRITLSIGSKTASIEDFRFSNGNLLYVRRILVSSI
jgi:hypothetical protein